MNTLRLVFFSPVQVSLSTHHLRVRKLPDVERYKLKISTEKSGPFVLFQIRNLLPCLSFRFPVLNVPGADYLRGMNVLTERPLTG